MEALIRNAVNISSSGYLLFRKEIVNVSYAKDGNCIRLLLIPLQMETFACLLSSPNEQLE